MTHEKDGGFSIRLLVSPTRPGVPIGLRRETDVPMKIARLCLGVWVAWAALPALAADAGIVTIVEGSARVLRGTVWYKLVPGAPLQEGDVIDAADKTQVQIEFTSAGTLHLVGPAALYAATIPWRNDKLDKPMELALDHGWFKMAATAAGAGTRLRAPSALVTVDEATLVMRQEPNTFELFVESGSVRIGETNRAGREGLVHNAKAGEYWSRDADKPFVTERRAPARFVAVMPRDLTDRLATLAAKFKGAKPSLSADHEITLAEADPWLAGSYRRTFARRFGGRLADPAFRKAVESNIAAYPEWDRVLHPEKYPAMQANPGAPTAVAPSGPVPAAPAATAKNAPPPAATAPGAPPKPDPRTALPFDPAGA